ncbi:glycosyltransferase family 2 protein [Sphingobacterium lumbrici]|uniref:glycosyltransferase family 2 protein n=1 Tax=Sphingobacterium lumbrici TaxID=2559600 RepID=UPI00112C745F|nr:glycosyltransferase [Sphingobacterium lumbrici]
MGKNNPEISVVISAYNASLYIEECIERILTQSFSDFELIIVNDGSIDDTVDKVKTFKDNRIQLIDNVHDFIGSLNLGMTAAKGKYVARMEAEDMMSIDRLKIQYEYMKSHPEIDVCGGWMELFGASAGYVEQPLSNEDILLQMLFRSPFNNSTTMMKAELIKAMPLKAGIFHCYHQDYKYAEDYKLWTTLASKKYKFANITDILVFHRISEDQEITRKMEEIQKWSVKIQIDYLNDVVDKIVQIDPDFHDILEDTVQLCNNREMHFDQLWNLVYKLYMEVLIVEE